jgi:hypothetical protein
MRLTGAFALGLFGAGVYLVVFGKDELGTAMRGMSVVYLSAILLPALWAGVAALLFARRRAFAAVSVVGATLLTVALLSGGAVERVARKETLAGALGAAGAQGFGGLPVLNLHTVERSSEFYAAGRVAYDATGEPLKFEGAGQIEEYLRGKGGQALVIVPLEEEHQLFEAPGLEAKRVSDNGRDALVHVKTR